MVVIRLSRAGAKKRPFYHIVVTDSRRRRDSNSIESIGYFNPVARGQEIRTHLEMDKLNQWNSVGAQMSDRVKSLVKQFMKDNAIAVEPPKKVAKKATKKAKTQDTAKPATKKTTAKTATKKAASPKPKKEVDAE